MLLQRKSLPNDLQRQLGKKLLKDNSGLVSAEKVEDHERETVEGNQSYREVGQVFPPESRMLHNILPIEAPLCSVFFWTSSATY